MGPRKYKKLRKRKEKRMKKEQGCEENDFTVYHIQLEEITRLAPTPSISPSCDKQ